MELNFMISTALADRGIGWAKSQHVRQGTKAHVTTPAPDEGEFRIITHGKGSMWGWMETYPGDRTGTVIAGSWRMRACWEILIISLLWEMIKGGSKQAWCSKHTNTQQGFSCWGPGSSLACPARPSALWVMDSEQQSCFGWERGLFQLIILFTKDVFMWS